ncbi:hypothetical protein BZL29_7702 [Mycobacterium kansasii]|uniref:Uncharacterized protein n=1 Tax=Mycobacterium kansasii TaxID=1768 RepID=A0A1V3WEM5_MYCKA|nr:hypothetical protein BZL29_7702 [Mycobacterium kansasii]
MGLRIRAGENDFSMGYSAFEQLRRDLARLIDMEAAVDGKRPWPKVDTTSQFISTGRTRLDDLIVPRGELGPPPELQQQPLLALVFLLDHPTNQGYLSSDQCEWLVPALEQVIALWVDDAEQYDWVGSLEDLRDCCRFAADNHVALEFG